MTVVHGASGGIGLEFARQLAARGEAVVATSRASRPSAALEALGAGARARRPRGPAAAPVRPGRPPRARAGGPRGGERQVRFSL